ncbi:MAG: TIGR03936 family radical SAM-associated protein [candidate division Zixibacteria bacterium]
MAAVSAKRLRIRWGRTASHTHLSHLDNIRTIEDAIRRSDIPVMYSRGKHPRMKLSFSPPLPVGFTSETEFFDINLKQDYSSQMINTLRKSMPEGFKVLEAKAVFARTAALSEVINLVVYTLKLDNSIDTEQLQSRICDIMSKDKLIISRKSKSGESDVNIRKSIYKIEYSDCLLTLTLGIGSEGYVRPTEIGRLLFEMDENEVSKLKFHRAGMFRQVDENSRIPAIEL